MVAEYKKLCLKKSILSYQYEGEHLYLSNENIEDEYKTREVTHLSMRLVKNLNRNECFFDTFERWCCNRGNYTSVMWLVRADVMIKKILHTTESAAHFKMSRKCWTCG